MDKWKLIAAASRFDIPEEELNRIAPVLEALEAAFRPLAKNIPVETEPAFIFHAGNGERQS
ncbi:MAG TPA: hypothetical protein PLA43_00845 [Bryobacteraceae bacterium]|nr:hypothetical protein [Bryobacteraceae bacterium]HOL71974.1 hypothetical protein [Bryobacteraceae bacterium]HOQ44156.1 hypothetical protein [Bryobacteraceae bacterium]HPQ15671.1 hypothetical protein [Bryobacteraceae bacterium]HPU70474.1 hypothetical protein [Bryobacteraceae bacterium]